MSKREVFVTKFALEFGKQINLRHTIQRLERSSMGHSTYHTTSPIAQNVSVPAQSFSSYAKTCTL